MMEVRIKLQLELLLRWTPGLHHSSVASQATLAMGMEDPEEWIVFGVWEGG
jgi:hypothetical protein